MALDVRPKRVFQPVWTGDAFRMECVEFIQLLLSIWNRRCISTSLCCHKIHKITNVNSSETLDWHLQHINYAHILRNEEMANAELCDHVGPSWFCGDLLWKTLLWVTMTTGALPAGELMIIIAYITLSRCGLSWSLSQSTIQTLLFSRVSVTAKAS